jgi:signal transduction histidine kinase
VDELLRSINEKVEAFTRIYNSVNPTMLRELGLETTLENLILSFKSKSKIAFNFIYELKGVAIDYNISLALYRIVKEGITNIINDSDATIATISLKQQDQSILLQITDNGKGFDSSKIDNKHHFGILGMRELCYAINGVFDIHAEIAKG